MAHTCHAIGCDVRTPPKLFMCGHHWRMVPKDLQDAVWVTYTPGQERDLSKVTQDYLDTVMHVRRVVHEMESAPLPEDSQ